MPLLEVSTLDERLAGMRRLIVGILADPPATKLDLKRLLSREIGIDPKPETLHVFSTFEEISDRTGRETVMRALVAHLVVETTLADAWGSRDLDLDRLRRCLDWMPSLLTLHRDEQEQYAAAIDTVDRMERDAVRRLRAGLVVAAEHLFAVGVVVPEVERLVLAARENRLGEAAPSLDADEVEMIVVAAREATDAARPDREVVDAIALRALMERDVAAWRELASEPEEDAAEERNALRARLEAERAAHDVVSPRLDALRSRRFQESRAPSRHLDQVRRRLFTAFLELKRALSGQPGDVAKPAAEIRQLIHEAESAAAEIDAEQERTANAMREAADPTGAPEPLVEEPSDLRPLARERRRKKVLTGIAIALVPVAIGTNVFLGSWGRAPMGLTPKDFEKALPLQEVVPIPGAMYAQVSSLLWESMSPSERRLKVDQVAQVARREGFSMLLLVDENRRELARSSVARGTELLPLGPIESTAEAAAKAP